MTTTTPIAESGIVTNVPRADEREMQARYPGKCKQCLGAIAVGENILYSRESRATRHAVCDGARAAATWQQPTERRMTSIYRGVCGRCGGFIEIGTEILYSKMTGARHLECPERPVMPTPRTYATTPRQPRVYGPSQCKHCGRKAIIGDLCQACFDEYDD